MSMLHEYASCVTLLHLVDRVGGWRFFHLNASEICPPTLPTNFPIGSDLVRMTRTLPQNAGPNRPNFFHAKRSAQ